VTARLLALGIVLLGGACAERALGLSEASSDLLDSSRTDLAKIDLAKIDLASIDLTSIDAATCPRDTGGGSCASTLKAVSVQAQPGCDFIEHVTTSVGQLTFPCAGGLAASATFGPDTFSGSVSGNQLSLSVTLPFDWSDGCHWTTTQTIEGDVCGTSTFVYSEAPLPGQSGCASSCKETAQLLGE
jgi:hypothetical protein